MPPLHLLIKPASGNCNLRCRYCFYEDVTDHREVKSFGVMSLDTLEAVLSRALAAASRSCTIAFQGGEPTLAGLEFFRQAVELARRHNRKGLELHYAIQTNGMVLDNEWCNFFARQQFLVGLSLDGVKETHDHNRVDAAGKGTFAAVMHAAQLLARHRVGYNILTVVSAQTAGRIGRIYGFYKKNGFLYQQYIPCLDPFGEPRGQRPYSLTPAAYGTFLKTLFDLWYTDLQRGEPVSIRWFDNLVNMCRGYPPESCGMAGVCSRQLVVEADGSVYPCDFYVLDDWRLGNLATDSLEEIERRREELGFIALSRQVDARCGSCPYYPLCRGGCRRDREPLAGQTLACNYYCESFQAFFAYATPRLQQLARGLR